MKLESNEIKKYLKSNKFDFKLFKMYYTPTEILNIDNFNLNKENSEDYFGNLENFNTLNTFLTNIGNNTNQQVNKIEKLIIRIIKKVLAGYQLEHFWISIRITQPNNNFDIPRWHKDGLFFVNDNKQFNSKFVTTFKSNGTLFIRSTKKVNNIYNKFKDARNAYHSNKTNIDTNYRSIFAKALEKEKIIQSKNDEGIIFFTGNEKDKCALHSEPSFSNEKKPRLFISILPGSKINISELKKRFNL